MNNSETLASDSTPASPPQSTRTAVNASASRDASPRAEIPRGHASRADMPVISSVHDSRPEAPPLPRKIGELSSELGGSDSNGEASAGPSRTGETPREPTEADVPHPAEMPVQSMMPNTHHRSESESTVGSNSSSQGTAVDSSMNGSTTSVQQRMPMPSMPAESQPWYRIFHSRNHQPIKSLGGIRPPTLIRLLAIIFALAIDIAAWIVVIIILKKHDANSSNDDSNDDNGGNGGGTSLSQNIVFVSIAFAIIGILLLVFLERTIFIVRAERYRFTHPNASHSGRGGDESLSAMPWSRPSLPTYAAAIGFRGTGDAEDAEIVRQGGAPPPTYGKSKDDRLLARNSVRRSMAQDSTMPASESIEMTNPGAGRPVSYNTSALLQTTSNNPVSRPSQVEDMHDVDLSSPVAPTRREGANPGTQLRISTASEVLGNPRGPSAAQEVTVASATDSARSIIMQRDAEQARAMGAALSRPRAMSPAMV